MRKTKLAMLQSVVALILCAAMLVGTTFAWFTDSVTSGVNKIQAGNLDVDLVDAAGNSLEGTSLTFMDVTGNTDILWEPGCTFKTQGFRVANRGSLALEYTMYINGLLGDSKLLEAIDFSVQDADGYTVDIDTFEGQLSPKASSDVFYLVGHMDENAGNEYMNLTLTGIGITVYATQAMEESDAFGPEYDKDAFFPGLDAPILGSVNITTENDLLTADAVIVADGAKVTIPAGTRVEPGTTTLKLRVKLLEETSSNVQLGVNEVLQPMDVTVEGISEDNHQPLTVELSEIAPVGLNMGSIALHHVHNGTTVTMTRVAADAAFTADNQYRYDPATGDLALHMATFSEVAVVADTENAWEGDVDHSWYDADATELTIANADQLWSFSQIVGGMNGKTQDSFAGKTVKLIADINLGDKESENNPNIIFYPIGYYNSEGTYERTNTAITSGLRNFEGTFDGNGHTVSNFYQNTWEMKGDHDWYSPEEQYYRDGMGLFGRVYKCTVKNLTIKNFSSDGEITTTGCVAAYADGATFENIAIFNCNPRVYNIGNGGIVGCVGWYAKEANLTTTFTNITVDNSNKISALWGSYDVACGGIVGQYYPTSGQSSVNYPKNAGIEFTNCHVSAVMDVYNDVCANYQYYAYRYTGMLIGSVRENETIDGHVYPKMDGITAEDCTVHFGDWNDYYYCELVANSLASYTHDHQMSRLEQVASVDVSNKTVTDLAGKTMAIPTSGRVNYVVVKAKDANGMWIHGDGHDYAECYHFVNGVQHFHDVADADNPNPTETVNGVAGVLKEDKQLIYREFNNLVTGYGWGVTSKGVGDLAGVTILDREVGNSVVKFEKADTAKDSYMTEKTITIGELFKQAKWDDTKLTILNAAVNVTVSPVGEGSTVSGKFERNTSDWTKSTLTFSGTGAATITITDYYFCTATTINVNITERAAEEKFDVVMNNGDFLHRVGNVGTVALGKLFAAKSGASIGTASVTVEAVNGTAASGTYTSNATWTNGTIKFNGTGVVKVTIKDDDSYCIPTVLYLEVVDAVNATTATSAKANNVVLLNDCGFSSLEVSGGYALYGNGFTMTCASDAVAKDRTYSFVTLDGGTLDNVKIVAPNFSHAIMYEKNKSEDGNTGDGDGRYNNIRSAVLVTGNSQITNSYISGGRAAVYATSGVLTIENSTIYGGAVANIQTEASCNLVLEDVTLVQKPIKANVNDTTKTVMGLSVVTMCGTDGAGSPITLKGYLHQYAWANRDYAKYVPSNAQNAINGVLSKTDYIHSITYEDGVTRDSVNLGIVYMPNGASSTNAENMKDTRSNINEMPYGATTIQDVATVYTYKNTNGTDVSVATEPSYTATTQGPVIPSVKYEDVNENRVFTTTYDETKAQWKSTLKVDVDAGDYSFSFAKLLAQKYGKNLSYTVKTEDGTAVDKNAVITLNSAVSKRYVLTITDDQIYGKNGNITDETVETTYIFELLSTKTSLPAPTWTSKTLSGTPYIVVDSKGGDWNCAVPVLDGLKVKYWSKKQNKEIELDLANVVSAAGLSDGLQNGSNNTITITVADEYTLTITTTGFKTNDNGKPVVVDGKLYFTVSSSSNYVSTSTTSRTPNISYVFTDANNSAPISLSTSMNVVYATYKSKQYKYSSFCKGNLEEATTCFTPDTLITLADGTQKRVDELTFGDKILAWDFFTGTYVEKDIALLVNHGESLYRIANLAFSDGTALRIIAEHGVFDYDLNKFVYITVENMHEYVGHRFVQYAQDGSYSIVTLTDAYETEEYTSAWSITSAGTSNAFASGLLTVAPPEDFYNWIEMDGKLHYDVEQFQKDVQTYGLYTYEDFKDYVTYEQFVDWNGAYLKIAVEKGYFTFDYILELIELYKGWMPNN